MSTRRLLKIAPKLVSRRTLRTIRTTALAGFLTYGLAARMRKTKRMVRFEEEQQKQWTINFIAKEHFIRDVLDNKDENIFLIIFNKRQLTLKQYDERRRQLFQFCNQMKKEIKKMNKSGTKFAINIIDRDDMEVVRDTWGSMMKDDYLDFFDFTHNPTDYLIYFKKKNSDIFFDINEKKFAKIELQREKAKYFGYFRNRVYGLMNPVQYFEDENGFKEFLFKNCGKRNTPLLISRVAKDEDLEISRLERFILKRKELKVIKDDVQACVVKASVDGEWTSLVEKGGLKVIKNDFNDIYSFIYKDNLPGMPDTGYNGLDSAKDYEAMVRRFVEERAFAVPGNFSKSKDVNLVDLSKQLDYLVEPRTSIYSSLNGEQVRQLFTDFLKADEKQKPCLGIDLNRMDPSSKKLLEAIGDNLDALEQKVQPQIFIDSSMKFYLSHLSPYHPQVSLYSYHDMTLYKRYKKLYFENYGLSATKRMSSDSFLQDLQQNLDLFRDLKGDETSDNVSAYLQEDYYRNVTSNNFDFFMKELHDKNKVVILGAENSKSAFFFRKNYLRKYWNDSDYILGRMDKPNRPPNFKLDIATDNPLVIVKLKGDDNYVVYKLPELDFTDFEAVDDERSSYLETLIEE